LKNILYFITILILTLCPAQTFAQSSMQSGTHNKLQSGFYIKNHLDSALEQEFCQKSSLNKRKTIDYFYGSTVCNKADTNKAKYYLKKSSNKAESRFAYAMILLREKGKLSDIYKLFLEAGALGVGEAYYNDQMA